MHSFSAVEGDEGLKRMGIEKEQGGPTRPKVW